MSKRIIVLVACLLAGLAARANATPVSYNETVSGDLGFLPGTLLTLDIGANTVSGTTNQADFDGFAFTVPAGMDVTQLAYSFVLSPAAGITIATARFTLDTGNAVPSFPYVGGPQTINLLGPSTVNVFSSALILGPGTYGIQNDGLGVGGTGDADWSATYTWTLDVAPTAAPVPEPASLLLLGTGVVGGALRRLRSRRA